MDFINPKQEIVSIGSCFADSVGNRLKSVGFKAEINPFGVLFNPHSILKNLKNTINGAVDTDMFLQRDESSFHYDFHSRINSESEEDLTRQLNDIQNTLKKQLLAADRLILTFGSAWVYRHIESNNIVANCHKIPQVNFKKELLNLTDLKADYRNFIRDLKTINPKLEVLLTVSPVRHVKDGLHENNLSKSTLHLLTHYLVESFGFVHYFPAYELIIDDLRDYRFYKEDLIHPTNQALNYVFEVLSDTYFTPKTKEIIRLKEKLYLLQNHLQIVKSKPDEKLKLKAAEIQHQIDQLLK